MTNDSEATTQDIFRPFHSRAGAPLSAAWLQWLGHALADSAALPEGPPDEVWEAALPALSAHALAPALYAALKYASPRPAIPAAAQLALAEAFQASAARSLRLELELERITAALAAEGVPCLLLKGAALGRTVYTSLAERPLSDIDLLVPRAGLAATQLTLAHLGYRCLSAPAEGRIGNWLYRYKAETLAVGATAANRGLLIEVHWTLTELPYYIERIDVREIWRAVQPAPGLPHAQIADPAVLLVHACAHLALHHSRDLRLIWLVDLDRLARRSTPDWERVIHLADTWGLGLAVAACLAVAERWLGTPVPQAIRAALIPLAADPICQRMWGMGDETLSGRWWRRARISLAAFDTHQRARYAAWLALRAFLRPIEWFRRP